MIKVVHLTYSNNKGGAAIAARRLDQVMNYYEISSNIITAKELQSLTTKLNVIQRIKKIIYNRYYWKRCNKQLDDYSFTGTWSAGFGVNNISNNQLINNADIIYLHWINNNMISIEEIGNLLSKGHKVIWFMHDMWPMTGGCHHSFSCEKYKSHCGECELLNSKYLEDLSYTVFERKIRNISNKTNLILVSPSKWLGECAKKSSIFKSNRIEIIPNIVDTSIFRPIQKTIARKALGLPIDRKLILFGCDEGTKNYYKGWNYLELALHMIDLKNCDLILFGQKRDNSLSKKFNTNVHFLGYLNDEFPSLCLAYNAVDVFVSPSIAENFSLTLCEASACGTPTVCFDVGGNSDIVLHKHTGYLAKYKDASDLAKGINWVLNFKDYNSLSNNAIEHITNLCSPKNIYNMHKTLIESILSK